LIYTAYFKSQLKKNSFSARVSSETNFTWRPMDKQGAVKTESHSLQEVLGRTYGTYFLSIVSVWMIMIIIQFSDPLLVQISTVLTVPDMISKVSHRRHISNFNIKCLQRRYRPCIEPIPRPSSPTNCLTDSEVSENKF
jgi:hypothetical protein